MTDYSKKKCVVCQRVGGIVEQSDGLYECQNCSTPYRPKNSTRKPASTLQVKGDNKLQDTDRFVWFSFTGKDGKMRTGMYDCPSISQDNQPTLNADSNKLQFLRYLYQTGRINEEEE